MERPLIDGQEKELFHHEKLAIVKGKVLVIIELIEYSITFVKKIIIFVRVIFERNLLK